MLLCKDVIGSDLIMKLLERVRKLLIQPNVLRKTIKLGGTISLTAHVNK